MSDPILPLRTVAQLTASATSSLGDATLSATRTILDDVRCGGDMALRRRIRQFEDRTPDALVYGRDVLEAAYGRLSPTVQSLLGRTVARIEAFARGQRACLQSFEMPIPGGVAGHQLAPVERVACYAPGGRFPLPSSVLMTAVTARAAGVETVLVVTPSTDDVMLGAAFVAGADQLLWAGGAHAIAAVAHGTETIPAVDMVVGPGNRWVTAAKHLVSGRVGIDMLAGPSELVVVADATVSPDLIAADLLAQAEHDPDARPIVVTADKALLASINGALEAQLADLPTAAIARAALQNGGGVVCVDAAEIVAAVNALAPEHLELLGPSVEPLAGAIRHYGGLFVGAVAAEVLGDYGAGPNHVLPTGGTARFTGGLSVFDFVRVRTWMRLDAPDDAQSLVADAEALARLEGLVGHQRSAARRRTPQNRGTAMDFGPQA